MINVTAIWLRRVTWADWLVISISGVLAALTLYAASYPVVDTGVFYLFSTVWPLAGIVWSVTLPGPMRNPTATAAALVLLAGSGPVNERSRSK